MKIPPPKEDTLLEIADMDGMAKTIKDNILNFYIITFSHYKEFMDVYDDRKLSIELILFWLRQYCFAADDGRLMMYSSDYEILSGRIYKEFCESMMNKLVDTGHLSLMWNKKKKIVYWKKNKV
jgi:hypothetical protein